MGLSGVLLGERFHALLNKNSIEYIPHVAVTEEPNDQVTIELFRICQEAVNNVIKHSQATTCQIDFLSDEDSWRLSIFDNGIGFDSGVTSKGHGLESMQDRAHLLGGQLAISTQDQGSKIEITVPR